jgi:hypothetical protein
MYKDLTVISYRLAKQLVAEMRFGAVVCPSLQFKLHRNPQLL